MKKYILKNGQPVEEPDIRKWAEWLEKCDRHIIPITNITESVFVSTVFLGMDHGWSKDGKHLPVLWETMIFGLPGDEYQERYTNLTNALEGHKRAVKIAKERN